MSKPSYMHKPLYLEDVHDTTKLTDYQIGQLRVKNTADEYTLTRHVHLLASHLKLTSTETLAEITMYRADFQCSRSEIRAVAKDFKTYLMYVLRWRCRGLSQSQATTKIKMDAERRRRWASSQRKFWSKK